MTFAKNFDAVWHVKRERSIRCLRASANLALAKLRGIESSAEIVGKRVVVSAVLRMASSSRMFMPRVRSAVSCSAPCQGVRKERFYQWL